MFSLSSPVMLSLFPNTSLGHDLNNKSENVARTPHVSVQKSVNTDSKNVFLVGIEQR